MQFRTGNEIRELFLRFFETKGHRRVHSSSLVPANDPTLLFTNAGMNQFKDVFLGAEKRDYSRATTSQKCVRAGGKHNDLENVGFTRRHHTFFEMLGNFSFGDYFKRDAIAFAWELVTSPEWMGIPKDRLYVTIFEGDAEVPRDDEAEQYWIETGVPKERIFTYGRKDNFWQMGETGPCGPCSELFYDMGIEAAETPGVDKPFGQDDARYVEIWNLVFMQFDRRPSDYEYKDGKTIKSNYVLDLLPKPSIDTGMGLERVAAVLQDKLSNYDTDLFKPLIERAADLVHFKYSFNSDIGSPTAFSPTLLTEERTREIRERERQDSASLRIIADHARAATFLINDGVLPSNEGRGYVLRKIMRRAIRHGRLLGKEDPFLYQMVYAVQDEMQGAYPELASSADRIAKVVQSEERQFARVIAMGSSRLDAYFRETNLLSPHDLMSDNLINDFANSLDERVPRTEAKRLISELLEYLKDENQSTFRVDTAEIEGFLAQVSSRKSGVDQEINRALLIRFKHFLTHTKPRSTKVLHGDAAFRYYETFGLPEDFLVDAARDAGFEFDRLGFDRARAEEQARARASWKGGGQKTASPYYREFQAGKNPYRTIGPMRDGERYPERFNLKFVGYKKLEVKRAKILAILTSEATPMFEALPNQPCWIVLDRTPFYAQAGGQIGDTGWLMSPDGNEKIADVQDSIMPVQGVRAIRVLPSTKLVIGDIVNGVVDSARRDNIRRNHTGTHLLHAALRQVLGRHVKQAGSAVEPNRLRFDFSHFAQVADEELQEIENIVNREILANSRVETLEDVPIDVAVNEYHAMALFGEKYGDKVRVVKLSDGFSTELCGGTHTAATGEIGLLKVTAESAVSSGVRRIEAVTGFGSLNEFRSAENVLDVVKEHVGRNFVLTDEQIWGDQLTEGKNLFENVPWDAALAGYIGKQRDEIKALRRELEEARMKSAAGGLDEAVQRATEVKGVKVLTHRADNLERGQLRTLVDNLKGKLGEGIVLLASAQPEGKVAIIAGVTPELSKRIQAGKIVGAVAKLVGGSGGGKAEIAEAGGKDQSQIDAALQAAPQVVADLLG